LSKRVQVEGEGRPKVGGKSDERTTHPHTEFGSKSVSILRVTAGLITHTHTHSHTGRGSHAGRGARSQCSALVMSCCQRRCTQQAAGRPPRHRRTRPLPPGWSPLLFSRLIQSVNASNHQEGLILLELLQDVSNSPPGIRGRWGSEWAGECDLLGL
jgi:hypothetical protein